MPYKRERVCLSRRGKHRKEIENMNKTGHVARPSRLHGENYAEVTGDGVPVLTRSDVLTEISEFFFTSSNRIQIHLSGIQKATNE